jgi:uncharacterized protein
MKFFLWVIIAIAVCLWFLSGKKSRIKSDAVSRRPTDVGTEAILQCATCGVHIPKSEALTNSGGLIFCSDAHRRQHIGS